MRRAAGLRASGLLAGLAAAAVLLPALRPPAGPAPLPLVVDAVVTRSGEVGLADGGQLLVEAPVRPGRAGAASGRVVLVSETAAPVQLAVRDGGAASGLEDRLRVRVSLGDDVVYDGPRGQLRAAPSRTVHVLPGERPPLTVAVALPKGSSAAAAGRRVVLDLQLTSSPVEA
ncbi:hypothetical protein SAMN05428996_2543 [Quadrisphaera sp. DSM 44207]|nr:hypothetical protein SAMN05428996_2543 [Quadrisphaera sp. DSM 44207]